MWIETETYIGPCRRGEVRKLRLFNRRHANEADRDPSLATLLRQLRTHAQNLGDETARRRFKLRLHATIDVAHRAQANAIAAELKRLDAAYSEDALANPRSLPVVEHLLDGAVAALG